MTRVHNTAGEAKEDSAKVLLVISSLGPGGAERVMSHMANYWARHDRPVGILTLAAATEDHYSLEDAVVRFELGLSKQSHSLLNALQANFQRVREIRRSLRSHGADVILSFGDNTNLLVLLATLDLQVPVLISERTDPRQHPIGSLRRWARRLLYSRSTTLVVQTQAVAQWATKMISADKVHVLANPIDRLPAPTAWALREKRILGVGRLGEPKGFDILIKAFARSRLPQEDWSLTILGDGPHKTILQGVAEREGVAARVQFAGVVPDVAKWMNRARVYVLSSRYEGFPNALLEAMAMGCACIATDCPSGPSEIIANHENGVLVPSDNVAALTEALDYWALDDQRAAVLAANAIAIRERYDVAVIMKAWDAMIHDAIESTQ